MSEKIGIVYSPRFGAGWSTRNDWIDGKSPALDQELARAIDRGDSIIELGRIAKKNWPESYTGGLGDITVMWVPEGTEFYIDEYDGSESIVF